MFVKITVSNLLIFTFAHGFDSSRNIELLYFFFLFHFERTLDAVVLIQTKILQN